MKSGDTVRRAFELHEHGWSQSAIATELGVGRRTVGGWFAAGEAKLTTARMYDPAGCPDDCRPRSDLPGAPYAYLLGQYLGDGWINLRMRRGVTKLTVTCCASYLGIVDECQRAIEAVAPANRVGRVARAGVIVLQCHSKHWPCLFPQCGFGPKHARPRNAWPVAWLTDAPVAQ